MVNIFVVAQASYAPSEGSDELAKSRYSFKENPLALESSLKHGHLRCYGRLHDHDIVFSQIELAKSQDINVANSTCEGVLTFAPFYLKGTVLDGAVYEVSDTYLESLPGDFQAYRLTRPPFFGADGERFSELVVIVEGQIVSEDGVRPIGLKEVRVTNRLVPARLSKDLADLAKIPAVIYPLALPV